MDRAARLDMSTIGRDIISGMVVFLVALPLCLGVALASGAPLLSGILAGIIGGILVGTLSGSQTSVSGPAAGLAAIVAAQIGNLGFDAFLLAVLIAGAIQIVLGLAQAGFIGAFFPSSVIKGLLAAIGLLLILKQIPHVFGHDPDPEGEMSFFQPDKQNTFTELIDIFANFHPGAALIGLASLALLAIWESYRPLKKSIVPAPLIVVLLGVVLNEIFERLGGMLAIEPEHLVQVGDLAESIRQPDFSLWNSSAIYVAAATIAIVASLETLLNLEAVDKIDPQQRSSPPNRELIAQGFGNMAAGLLGGIPVTSVIVRSSVNINAGGQTKLSTIVHGMLLLFCVVFVPSMLNRIPLASLAAILLVTGIKLVTPGLVKQMWVAGRYQFIPFAVTVLAIVFTDLLIGVALGLVVSTSFILHSNLRRPLRRIVEKHLGGDVLRIELASQVSFLNRAALADTLWSVKRGGHVLIDARNTVYIDPDVLDLIRDYKEHTAPAHGVSVSLLGFRSKYLLKDQIQYVDYSTREIQSQITAEQVMQILKDGNERFRTGQPLTRDRGRQIDATAEGQHPIAVVLSCIDSRTPAEIVFDLGLGDIFSVRLAGNITSRKVVGSMEFGCVIAGAKLIFVMGHTRCGAIKAAMQFACSEQTVAEATGCQQLDHVVAGIRPVIDDSTCRQLERASYEDKARIENDIVRRNVFHSISSILQESAILRQLVEEKKIAIAGGVYDVVTGKIEFLSFSDRPTLIRESERTAVLADGQAAR